LAGSAPAAGTLELSTKAAPKQHTKERPSQRFKST